MEQFGEKLRRLRGVTSQKIVAEALGIPQTTLSSLEKQGTIPRGDVLKKLSEFFKVSIGYFYDEPELKSSESARAWLDQLKGDAKVRDTIATRSSVPLDAKMSERLADRMRTKFNEKNSNKSR
jgi:transcriptional regulator with XRE-family HTH domain